MDLVQSHLAEGMGLYLGAELQRSSGPVTPWHQALREHRVSNWLSWSCSPHPECLAEADEAGVAGRAAGCQSPASSPVSATLGGGYGNTEGLGRGSSEPQAPGRSPGVQGRPSATTLKAKSPRTLLWTADLTSPTIARKGPNHQTAQTLLSAQAMGPQQVAPLTPAGTPHSQPSPEARSLSLELSQEE